MRKRGVKWVALALVAGVGAACVFAPASPVLAEPMARVWTWQAGGSYLGRQTVRMQEGAWDCGTAVLAMVLEAHGRRPSLAGVRKEVLERGRGLSLLEVQEVSARHGVPAEGWRLEFAALRRAPLPAIAHFDDHYVVVDRIAADGTVRLRDPAVGLIDYPRERFERLWTGNVLVFPRPRPREASTPETPSNLSRK